MAAVEIEPSARGCELREVLNSTLIHILPVYLSILFVVCTRQSSKVKKPFVKNSHVSSWPSSPRKLVPLSTNSIIHRNYLNFELFSLTIYIEQRYYSMAGKK